MEREQSWKAGSPRKLRVEEETWDGAETRGGGPLVRAQYPREMERCQGASLHSAQGLSPRDGESGKTAVAKLMRWLSRGARCAGSNT